MIIQFEPQFIRENLEVSLIASALKMSRSQAQKMKTWSTHYSDGLFKVTIIGTGREIFVAESKGGWIGWATDH